MLIFYKRQSVLDIRCLDNLNQPVSRLKLFSRDGQVNGRTDSGIIRVCKVQGYNAIVVSVSSTGTAYCIPLQLQSNAPSQGHLLAEPGSAADARLRSPQIQFPRFGTPGAVKTPHSILQLVVSQLNGCPSLFYLHSEGFEQTSLSASAFEGQKNPTDVESLDNDITAVASAVSSGLPQNIRASEEKEAFAPLSSRVEMDQKASFGAPPYLPESTSHKHSESQMCGSITPIGDDARMLGAMQQHLAEQNLVFAQMLATQQKMQEAQFLQLSREIAAM